MNLKKYKVYLSTSKICNQNYEHIFNMFLFAKFFPIIRLFVKIKIEPKLFFYKFINNTYL